MSKKLPKPNIAYKPLSQSKNAIQKRARRAQRKEQRDMNRREKDLINPIDPALEIQRLNKQIQELENQHRNLKNKFFGKLYGANATEQMAKWIDQQIINNTLYTDNATTKPAVVKVGPSEQDVLNARKKNGCCCRYADNMACACLFVARAKDAQGIKGEWIEERPVQITHHDFKVRDAFQQKNKGSELGVKNEQTYGNFKLKDSGERSKFQTGAVRDTSSGKGRLDLIPAYPLLRLAKLYEAGATKYAARNWEKGIPLARFMDSGFRHLLNYIDGDRTEDHLIACIWNLFGFVWTEEMIKRGQLPKELADFVSPVGPLSKQVAQQTAIDANLDAVATREGWKNAKV